MLSPARLFSAVLRLVPLVASFSTSKAADMEPLRFQVARFDAAEKGYTVTLFPLSRKQPTIDVTVPTPSATTNLISFASDGRSLYVQQPYAFPDQPPKVLFKIEFAPTRMSAVPGTEGLGDIWSIKLSKDTPRRMFVSASGSARGSCGDYEIDPQSGTRRVLRLGRPNCRTVLGDISPDGKRVLSTNGGKLSLMDLETGAVRPLGVGRGKWSPDGQQIAVSGDGEIVLLQAGNLSRRKRLGSSSVSDDLAWSPDSKYLLVTKNDIRCFMLKDAETLLVLDVRNGHRRVVEGGRCAVTLPTFGWVDPEIFK
jgi:WD40 repeat protein